MLDQLHATALQATIDDVASVDLRFVSDDELEAQVAAVSQAASRLQVVLATCAGEANGGVRSSGTGWCR
ncbi:MAG: hypothetical protein H0V96_07285 [Acidimicrobiia bacterium]|nr:hypothetical protein [Acidimicrobiia bacterium]